MKQNTIFFSVLLLVSLIIANYNFFKQKRLFITTILIDPITADEARSAFKSDVINSHNELLKYTGFEYISSERLNQMNIKLYANIVRYFQNNKSYKYLYAKEKNLNSIEKKNFYKIVKNISLEGAYFLNYDFLRTVKIQFRSNKENEFEVFNNYLNFIIEKEVNKFLFSKISVFYSNGYYRWEKSIVDRIEQKKKNLENLIFWLMIDYDHKNNEFNARQLHLGYDKKFRSIMKSLALLETLMSKPESFAQSYEEADYILKYQFLETLNDVKYFYKLTLNNEKNKDVFESPTPDDVRLPVLFSSNVTLSDKDINDFLFYFKHNYELKKIQRKNNVFEEVINEKILKNKIADKLIVVEKKFNLKEFISLNIFSIIFTIVSFALLRSFSSKK